MSPEVLACPEATWYPWPVSRAHLRANASPCMSEASSVAHTLEQDVPNVFVCFSFLFINVSFLEMDFRIYKAMGLGYSI